MSDSLQSKWNLGRYKHTPDSILTLRSDEIFVFGSNTAGVHGSGAARTARELFGAKLGVGEGLTGQSYAFPTLNADSHGGLHLRQRGDVELVESVRKFYQCCADNRHLSFLLTRVGCGLARYTNMYMRDIFRAPVLFLVAPGPPPNVVFPEGW